MRKKTLRLILGDQLNQKHSWYKQVDSNVTYVLFEMRQETDYVVHHIQKVIGFFAAMRAFVKFLKDEGHQVIYWELDDVGHTESLTGNLKKLIKENEIEKFEYQLPDEYRLDQQLEKFSESLNTKKRKHRNTI